MLSDDIRSGFDENILYKHHLQNMKKEKVDKEYTNLDEMQVNSKKEWEQGMKVQMYSLFQN